MTHLDQRFGKAKKVADAVLYEGYVLYPYRASARKNQLRWQFGVLVPPGCAAALGEPEAMRTELLAEVGRTATIDVRVRGLQIQTRNVEVDGRQVASLDTGDRVWTSFDEAVEHEIDLPGLDVGDLVRRGHSVDVAWDGAGTTEEIAGGRVVRARWPVTARVHVGASWCAGPGSLVLLSIAIENTTHGVVPSGRDVAVRQSLVAVHTLAAIDDGRFLSALDPPLHARSAAAALSSVGTFPVLIDDDVVLSSPIILYDRPAVAPESEGDMFDATEIDEILALRVLTLTDEEKREARGTDQRSAAVVDRCDAMTPESFERLHGTFRSIRFTDDAALEEPGDRWSDPGAGREEAGAPWNEPGLPWWDPGVDGGFDPWTDRVWIGDVEVSPGTRVRLHPSRRADAQDLFLVGLDATVGGVFHDVDGEVHLAVVVDADPGGDLLRAHGRYRYFHPDEVEILSRPDGAVTEDRGTR
ncbi:MAG: hypothetical protein ACHQNA_01465 [Acidimicrobiales bacterium]